MIPQSYIDYYGDQTRWFIGVVISIHDPLKLQRVKVRIYGIHSRDTTQVSDADLPWAQTVIPVTEGGSSGTGANTGIQVGAQVFGIFLDGTQSQLPLVVGSIPKIESVGPDYQTETGQGEKVEGVKPLNENQAVTSPEQSIKLLKGNNNLERAWNFFTSQQNRFEFTPIQVSGMLGNFLVESDAWTTGQRFGRFDINPEAVGDNGAALGIAQWNYKPRRRALKRLAADLNSKDTDIYAQLNFVIYELEGNINGDTFGRSKFLKTNTIEQATVVWQDRYEQPSVPHTSRRIEQARKVYKRFMA